MNAELHQVVARFRRIAKGLSPTERTQKFSWLHSNCIGIAFFFQQFQWSLLERTSVIIQAGLVQRAHLTEIRHRTKRCCWRWSETAVAECCLRTLQKGVSSCLVGGRSYTHPTTLKEPFFVVFGKFSVFWPLELLRAAAEEDERRASATTLQPLCRCQRKKLVGRKTVTDPMQIEADVAKMRSMDRRENLQGPDQSTMLCLVQVLFQCLEVFLINLLVCWTFQWLSEGRDWGAHMNRHLAWWNNMIWYGMIWYGMIWYEMR